MSETAGLSFIDRSLRNLRYIWRDIAPKAWTAGAAAISPDLPDAELPLIREQMQECLEARGGEVSARLRAASLGRSYLSLSRVGRERFLRLLATEFAVDSDQLAAHAREFLAAQDDDERIAAEMRLRQALVAPRVRLLTQFNGLPEGVKFLVDMRADLLPLVRHEASLKALDTELRDLLASWFDVGFLELRAISWDSSAAILEKLIAYEAVHAIRSWSDLRNRLDSDRRCYAFFHPNMPGEPLIFVEVALVDGIAGNVQALLDESAPRFDVARANTAIFYSISNTQKGLAGISFGNFLIKRVVDDLSKSVPRLRTFATLSPIPGFLAWLDSRLAEGEPGLLSPEEREALKPLGQGGPKGVLRQLVAATTWSKSPEAVAALKAPLMRLCARYLVEERSREGRSLDPVARFHLGNGARIERLNWMADSSEKGLKQSAGLMVNYLYSLDEIEANHEAYAATGRVAGGERLLKSVR